MKNISLFCALLLFLLIACKGNKSISIHEKERDKPTRNEYVSLEKKLHIDLTKSNNIKLYEFISDWLGTPHKLGNCNKLGIDCSCFVKLLYEEVYNQKIPRSSLQIFEISKRIEKAALKEGDVVFFNIKTTQVSHVGVYLKDGWFAHVSTSKGVMINNLSEKYYASYYVGAGKF
jgi:lipoprotein Spr